MILCITLSQPDNAAPVCFAAVCCCWRWRHGEPGQFNLFPPRGPAIRATFSCGSKSSQSLETGMMNENDAWLLGCSIHSPPGSEK
jgi:hypothetical protein